MGKKTTLPTKRKTVCLIFDITVGGIKTTYNDFFSKKARFSPRGPKSNKVVKTFTTSFHEGYKKGIEVFKNISTIGNAINIVKKRNKKFLLKAFYIDETGIKINLLKPIKQ